MIVAVYDMAIFCKKNKDKCFNFIIIPKKKVKPQNNLSEGRCKSGCRTRSTRLYEFYLPELFCTAFGCWRVDNFERFRSVGSARFLVLCEVGCFGSCEFMKSFQNALGVTRASSKIKSVGGESKVSPMLVHVVGLEDEVELEVDEAKRLELLVVGRMKVLYDDSELGEGDANEVHDTFKAVAGLWSGEGGDVSSGSRSHDV